MIGTIAAIIADAVTKESARIIAGFTIKSTAIGYAFEHTCSSAPYTFYAMESRHLFQRIMSRALLRALNTMS